MHHHSVGELAAQGLDLHAVSDASRFVIGVLPRRVVTTVCLPDTGGRGLGGPFSARPYLRARVHEHGVDGESVVHRSHAQRFQVTPKSARLIGTSALRDTAPSSPCDAVASKDTGRAQVRMVRTPVRTTACPDGRLVSQANVMAG